MLKNANPRRTRQLRTVSNQPAGLHRRVLPHVCSRDPRIDCSSHFSHVRLLDACEPVLKLHSYSQENGVSVYLPCTLGLAFLVFLLLIV